MNDWSYFNSIRCINLYEREDRYRDCSELFRRLNIPVSFYRTNRPAEGGCFGCYHSHLACIRESYIKGDETCLIFEDDIVEGTISTETLQQVINFIQREDDWDIFHLGCHPLIHQRQKRINSHIMLGPCLNAHAYIINRSFMARMLEEEYVEGRNIDVVYSSLAKSYYLYPAMFYQGNYGSDCETSTQDTLLKREKLKFFEMYAYYIGWPWPIILALIIIIIITIIIIRPPHLLLWIVVAILILLLLLHCTHLWVS